MAGPPRHPSPARRIAGRLLAIAALTALLWAGWTIGGRLLWPQPVTARPALWQIEKEGRRAWLFGTIHAVPAGDAWLSPAIARAAAHSDRLLLEATGLDAERHDRAVFERLGKSSGLPPVEARLPPPEAAQLRALIARHGAALRGLDAHESWAAALLVNAAATTSLRLSAEQGGEAVLTGLFARSGKPIGGLEAIERQLGLFDSLPEAEQRRLLVQAVRDAGRAARQLDALHDAWSRGDVAQLEAQYLGPVKQAPILYAALIEARNRRWAAVIDEALLPGAGPAFIAVGAGHLLGPDSLQMRLAERGWRIARVQ
jgi:uncharacterized protein YbaP (TraB family)